MSKYTCIASAILGLSLLAINPLTAEAQHGGHGGGHGGGGHAGGGGGHYHGGGGHYHGGGGYFYGGGRRYYGGYGGFYPGWGYGFYAPYYGYGRGYGYSGPSYYGSYYDEPYYDNYAPSYNYAPFDGYMPPAAVAPPVNNTAEIVVTLPRPDAQVWVDGKQMSASGTQRSFVSPALEPGYSYSYRITAAWMDNGQEVRVERTVAVAPGRTSTADFSRVNAARRARAQE